MSKSRSRYLLAVADPVMQLASNVLAVTSVGSTLDMSHSSSSPDPPGLEESIEVGINRVSRASDDGDAGHSLTEAVSELLDVPEQTDALLETIDLDELPDAIDLDALPDLVDFEHLLDAIRDRDADAVLDLSNLDGVVDRRKLWNLVDLLEFAKAKQRLDRELEDVVVEDAQVGGDSEAAADVEAFASSLGDERNDRWCNRRPGQRWRSPGTRS